MIMRGSSLITIIKEDFYVRKFFVELKTEAATVAIICLITAGILFGHYATIADSNKEVVPAKEVVTQSQDVNVNVNVDISGDVSIAELITLLLTTGTTAIPAVRALHKRNKVRKEMDKVKL